MAMHHALTLAMFVALVLGGGLVIGYLTAPGPWYAALEKPPFNPPGWVFGPVWTVLYVLIAIAGWRIWEHAHGSLAMKVWWGQLALNFLWSPVFFAAHRIDLALAVIVLLLATTIGFVGVSWRVDRLAAALFVPYVAWVAFATLLNASILALNR